MLSGIFDGGTGRRVRCRLGALVLVLPFRLLVLFFFSDSLSLFFFSALAGAAQEVALSEAPATLRTDTPGD